MNISQIKYFISVSRVKKILSQRMKKALRRWNSHINIYPGRMIPLPFHYMFSRGLPSKTVTSWFLLLRIIFKKKLHRGALKRSYSENFAKFQDMWMFEFTVGKLQNINLKCIKQVLTLSFSFFCFEVSWNLRKN